MPDSIADLEARLQAAAAPAAHIDALNALAWELQRSDTKRALTLCQEAERLSAEGEFAQAPYRKGLAESLRTQGRLNIYTARYDLALIQSMQALELADQIHNLEIKPAIYNTIASSYRQLGDISESLDYYRKQEEACQAVGNREETGKALLGIGVVYYDIGDQTNFLQYSERALAIFRDLGLNYWISLALNNVSYALFKLQRHDEAMERGQEGLALCRRVGDQRGALRLMTSLGEVYFNQGRTDEALELLHEALDLAQVVQEPDLENDALRFSGEAYLQVGDYDQALAFLQRTLQHSDQYKLRRSQYEAHRSLSEAYKKMGDFAKALEHRDLYYQYKDAVFSEENAIKLRNMEVLYRTQASQKEAEYFSQLYDQTRRFNEQLEAEVQSRTEDVRRAYEQLDRMDRTKTNFITVTAHELRTPITVLRGYAQMLQKDEMICQDAARNELVTGIVAGATRMGEIINTMLLMVKIDSRTLRIYPEPVDLYEMLLTITAGLGDVLKERQLVLQLDSGLEGLPAVEADREALTVVFQKLVENGIKYTPNGGRIDIRGNTWEQAPRPDLPQQAVEVVVEDSGIGVDPGQLELIFTKFYQTGDVQVHSSSKSGFKGGGPGLGLAIARGIIEAHQGKLWADSEGYDEKRLPGSKFHVVLPLKQA